MKEKSKSEIWCDFFKPWTLTRGLGQTPIMYNFSKRL